MQEKDTILYNTATQRTISKVYSSKENIVYPRSANSPIIELDYINTPPPSYNPAIKVATSSWVIDLIAKKYRLEWQIRDKTVEELLAEQQTIANTTDDKLEPKQIKKALHIVIKNLSEKDQADYPSFYPAYRAEEYYEIDDKFQYNRKLYKVLAAHKSQLSWIPSEVPTLYQEVNKNK